MPGGWEGLAHLDLSKFEAGAYGNPEASTVKHLPKAGSLDRVRCFSRAFFDAVSDFVDTFFDALSTLLHRVTRSVCGLFSCFSGAVGGVFGCFGGSVTGIFHRMVHILGERSAGQH